MKCIAHLRWPLGFLLLLGCLARSSSSAETLKVTPYRNKPASRSDSADAVVAPLFEMVPSDVSQVTFAQPIDLQHPQKYLYVGGYASAGVAIGDLDGDDLPDLVFTGGPVENRLYLQEASDDATPRFRDATSLAGLAGNGHWSAGVTLVDIDADHDLDVYICNYDKPNELYLNETRAPGAPEFREAAAQFGLDLVDASFQATFCDYDQDGDLDVFVTCYQYVNPAGRPAQVPVKQIGNRYEVLPEFQKYYAIVRGVRGNQVFRNVGRRDYLMKNLTVEQGRTQFIDVTEAAGISGRGVANSAVWWDYDGDQDPDLFVANDFKVADQLWCNNGDGTFTDVVKSTFPHITWFSMGSDVGDVNNDGLLDLFVSDMAGTSHYRSKVTMGEMGNNQEFLKYADPPQYMRNALFINTGTPRFLEAAYMAGLSSSDWTWTTKLADFDNDGLLDAYLTNGAARMFNHSDFQATDQQRIGKTQWDLWEATPPRKEENLAFRNVGDLQFVNHSEAWGLKRESMSYAAAHGDLDNDGDLDLVVANLDEPVSIYLNQSANTLGHHSLRLRLQGPPQNTSAWGAQVRIETKGGVQTRQVSPTTGFLSCNESVVHFGLGTHNQVDQLVVTWPGGMQQRYANLQADQTYTVTYEANEFLAKEDDAPSAKNGLPWFRPSTTIPTFRHQELAYDDFARQPLLPYAHSQLGPGWAAADVDGDGDLDYYHGKSKGSRRAVYDRQPRRVGVKTVLDGDEGFEDMGVLFFDADRDGEQDLYVVSGSVEGEPGDESLSDRFYRNDGTGRFQRDLAALPPNRDSGSVVCGADYDHDGDIDLFVGSRVVPGKYPITPQSRFLENVSRVGAPKFEDKTDLVSPGLMETGLVTSAIWADVDNDGWQDLLVTHEWGTVKLYRNEAADAGTGRRLVSRSDEANLSQRTGWWNGIAAADLDHDGDLDFVVTNFGLNTQYHASDEKPELLYYGEFDESGKPHLLEAKFEADKCYPRRGMSCSSHAMPFVRDKLQTFHAFGLATLADIYTPQRLADALQLHANTLESGVLLNQSEKASDAVPTFAFVPLPRLAQIAPSFGVSIRDYNGDGAMDVMLAQNFYAPQVETGHMDGGVSLLLAGLPASDHSPQVDGRQGTEPVQFRPVWPRESGVVVPEDATAAASGDFNQDGVLDVLIAVNDGPVYPFEGRLHPGNRHLQVTLSGPAGNLDCVGARVTLQFADGTRQMQEVHAGGGYLTQESGPLFFGCGARRPVSLEVRWPHNETSRHDVPNGANRLTIQQP